MMHRTLPGLAVEKRRRAHANQLSARQAVSGVRDLCGGCDIRSGTGVAQLTEGLRPLCSDKCDEPDNEAR